VIDPGPIDGSGFEAGPTRRSGAFAWVAGLLVLLVVALVTIWAVVLRAPGDSAGPSPLPATPTATLTPSPTATTPDPEQIRLAALEDLLRSRERAVRDKDAAAWLATVDPEQAAFRARQAAQFANLARLPLSRWEYSVLGPGPALSPPRQSALGPDAWVAQVDLGYRFGAADRSDVHSTEYLTLVDRDGSWLVASDTDAHSATEIWDLGPLTVLSGRSSVVIGLGSSATLTPYVAQADAAVTRVSAIWGTAWPRRVVVLVPKTQAQMGRLLDRSSATLDQIAAVTTGELTAAEGAPSGGADQIIVNPAGFAKLGALGRRVVITHEATHVAVRASTPRQVAIWLSEGFADYVGYSGLGLPRTEVASDVLGLVRRGTGPKALPDNEDFDATQSSIGPAYSASWLACSLIADRYGQAALLALYRAASGATAVKGVSADMSPEVATTRAFPAVLGLTEAAFTKYWLRYLTTLSKE
jgi:hypothetical protein